VNSRDDKGQDRTAAFVSEIEAITDAFERDTAAARAAHAHAKRLEVRVLLTVGDDAELVTPDHSAEAPLRVPAADIARDAGLPANELPGRRFTAVRDGHGGFRDFRLVFDPRV
jgi:hypothetical protein